MILTQVPIQNQDLIPPRAVQDILDAMEYSTGEKTLKQVVQEIQNGDSQIWIKFSDQMEHLATVVTCIIDLPNKRSCVIEFIGGESVLPHTQDIKAIEDWARYNGCADTRIVGREGWVKALKPNGYQKKYTIVCKDLTGGG